MSQSRSSSRYAEGLCLLGLVILPLCGCATWFGGNRVALAQVADELADADVIFLGEIHDNAIGHRQHFELLRLLHARRPNLVLSLEMFERDVQDVVDDFLAAVIDEEEFLENARPWPNYRRDYRPMVEYARQHGLVVVAANAPQQTVRKVAREGLGSVRDDPHVARSIEAPRDAYWESFRTAMDEHAGVDEESMWRFYEAQCVRDETMAESIVIARGSGAPLVVHVCGEFHAVDRMGTVERVLQRSPGLRCAVVTMEAEPNLMRIGRDDYVLVVPPEPPKPKRENAERDAVAPDGEPAGRPALGFMPNYENTGDGLQIEELRADGPAARAGLQAGDVILRLAGRDVFDVGSYMEALGSLSIGSKVEVVAERNGTLVQVEVVVGSRDH